MKWLDRSFLLACLFGANFLQGQPAFLRKDIPVADRPSTVIIGDFNGDSRPDMVVSSLFDGTWLLLGTDGGDFGRPIHSHSLISAKLAADFNRDGRLDLVGIEQATQTVFILLGLGDGTFLPRQEIGRASLVATGDFNGDRIPDLVFDRRNLVASADSTFLLLGNGDGTFQSGVFIGRGVPSWEEVLSVEVADFNADGRSDLALFDGWWISVFLGQGDGTFLSPVDTIVWHLPGSNTHYGSSGIVVADFNHDGLPDIATRSDVILGKGDGSFHSPLFFLEQSTAKGDYPHTSAAADLDGDGHQDLIINYNSNFVSVFRGKGDGTLSPSMEFPVGPLYYLGVVTGDLDGDGLPDLATANARSNNISLLLNRSALP